MKTRKPITEADLDKSAAIFFMDDLLVLHVGAQSTQHHEEHATAFYDFIYAYMQMPDPLKIGFLHGIRAAMDNIMGMLAAMRPEDDGVKNDCH